MTVLRFPPMAGNRLDAAVEWVLSEIPEPASVESIRAHAARELRRPRTAMHRAWAEEVLRETEHYVAKDSH